jgi:amino acid permease
MTFWETTQSDLFAMYPPMRKVDSAKILLCITMLLTFPLPFFACREMLIMSIIRPLTNLGSSDNIHESDSTDMLESRDLQEPLLEENERHNNLETYPAEEVAEINDHESNSVIFEDPRDRRGLIFQHLSQMSVMIPGEEKQLSLPFHVALSLSLWGFTTFLAIVAPNLGDILDLVGAASGTSMTFILPGLLSLKLQGYTNLGIFILLVGGAIGLIGTAFSLKKLVLDVET